jgi:hypothetical protein
VGTTAIDGVDATSLDLGTTLGYQIEAGPAQVCPMASGAVSLGPNNIGGSGIDATTYGASVGVAFGVAVGSPQFRIAPFGAIDIVYAKLKLEDDFGSSLTGSNTFGQGTLGLGFVFSDIVSVRPTLMLPIGLENTQATFGLVVGINFGPRALGPRPAAASAAAPSATRFALDKPAPGYRLIDEDVPDGAHWIAQERTHTYYPVGCPSVVHIPLDERLYYRSDETLRTSGYTLTEAC